MSIETPKTQDKDENITFLQEDDFVKKLTCFEPLFVLESDRVRRKIIAVKNRETGEIYRLIQSSK